MVGYGVEVHYCLGQIADVNYALLDTSCACDEVDEIAGEDNCCNEESFFIQLDTEHQSAADQKLKQPVFSVTETLLATSSVITETTEHLKTLSRRGPPKTVDRIIEYHSFIFYG